MILRGLREIGSQVIEDLIDLAGSKAQVGAQRANVVSGGHDRPVSGKQDTGKADAPKIGCEASGACGEVFLFVPEGSEIAAGCSMEDLAIPKPFSSHASERDGPP